MTGSITKRVGSPAADGTTKRIGSPPSDGSTKRVDIFDAVPQIFANDTWGGTWGGFGGTLGNVWGRTWYNAEPTIEVSPEPHVTKRVSETPAA